LGTVPYSGESLGDHDRPGVQLPLESIFDLPTVAGLASEIEEMDVPEDSPLGLARRVAAMSDEDAARLLKETGD
jgi:hypothetical protein